LQVALSSDSGAFVALAMAPVYQEVQKAKGRGAPKIRKDLFENRVCAMSGIWVEVHDQIETSFRKVINQRLDQLAKDIEDVLHVIHQNFVMLCDTSTNMDESEKALENELRQTLHKNRIIAEELVEGDIKALAEYCKGYSTKRKEDSMFVEE
jgi:hypothetical protein